MVEKAKLVYNEDGNYYYLTSRLGRISKDEMRHDFAKSILRGMILQNQVFMDNKNNNRTLMGVLAYLGPLVIVSYLVSKDDSFVKFHIKQGLVLVVIEIIMWVLGSMFWSFWMIMNLINLAVLILSIVGIVNVTQNKEKELPFVGQFSRYFSF